METTVLQFLASTTIPIRTNNPTAITIIQTQIFLPRRGLSLRRHSTNSDDRPQPVPPTITPPDTVEIRFKRGSRKRTRKEDANSVSSAQPVKLQASDTPKKWEDMNMTEKAMELYMGEKGLLFWLNKFAYASIFFVIGGWILFRFVGPALNLYQLDTPPLSPSSMFKSS